MQSNTNINSINSSRTPSIFELVERTKKFIRFELVHAGVAVAIFFGIFLVLQPWNYSTEERKPYWMVGPPLVYFMLDLLFALILHFSMLHELRPKTCKIWMFLQVGNLCLLTLLGFFMIWQIEFVDYTYLKLITALVVLYVYKAYRISIMNSLVFDMNVRCSLAPIGSPNAHTSISNSRGGGNLTFAGHHQIVREQIFGPTYTIPVQQSEPNVKQQSEA